MKLPQDDKEFENLIRSIMGTYGEQGFIFTNKIIQELKKQNFEVTSEDRKQIIKVRQDIKDSIIAPRESWRG